MLESITMVILSVAVATERLTEVVQPIYLCIKNKITKKQDVECTKTEKIVIATVVAVILALISGVTFGVTTIPVVVQQITIGLFASLGSNVVHSLINIITAFKDAAEDIKKGMA